jgi:membrane dipeptidase
VTSQHTAARALLSRFPLVDGHNDLPWELREAGSEDLDQTNLAAPVAFTHTDLPIASSMGVLRVLYGIGVRYLTRAIGARRRPSTARIEDFGGS